MTNCTCGDCPECRPPGRILEDNDWDDAYDIQAQQDLDDWWGVIDKEPGALVSTLFGIGRALDPRSLEEE